MGCMFLHCLLNSQYDKFSQYDNSETFEEHPILPKFKEGENFNHRNTLSISRIALSLHFVPKFEPDAGTLVKL